MRQTATKAHSGMRGAAASMVVFCVSGHATAALADPNCTARILADVPALEAPEQVKSKRSGTFGPVTHVKVAKASGQMYLCSHNSYCYGSNAFQFITPCRFKLDKAAGSDDFFQYSAR